MERIKNGTSAATESFTEITRQRLVLYEFCPMPYHNAHHIRDTMLGGYAAGSYCLRRMTAVRTGPSVYYPQFLLFYGILLGVTLLSSPLTMGSYAWFSELSMMRRPKVREVFNWLGDIRLTVKAFGAELWFLGICVIWAVVFWACPLRRLCSFP